MLQKRRKGTRERMELEVMMDEIKENEAMIYVCNASMGYPCTNL